jgi:predicted SAM-dependent methyltransferase
MNTVAKIKQLLKRSAFAVAVVRAIRAGIADLRVLYWLTLRKPRVAAYLKRHPVRRLHLGASNTVLAGWLNTDLIPTQRDVIYLDVTRRFPFRDNTFDYIFSEHLIEHVDYESGLSMLGECARVLKPGGRIRVATPDLKVLTDLHSTNDSEMGRYYVDWIVQRLMPEVECCKEVFVINNAFRNWGHQFLYDAQTLTYAMKKTGFDDIRLYKPGISDETNLRGMESHGKLVQWSEIIDQYETFVVEGRATNLAQTRANAH